MNKGNSRFQYDAFISYRHVPLDTAAAIRLQHLLENYRPPKNLNDKEHNKIQRIFRDQSELTASSDLGNAIHTALQQSRYLIVVCSEQLKDSAWCMEEIRYFKELHQGRVDHILILLVSGNADEVIPDILLSEDHTTPPPSNGSVGQPQKLTPLYVDIRSSDTKTCIQKLKTEFLRIAAPILGCRFDELFQRHQRQKRKIQAIISASIIALLSSVLLIVSIFACKAWASEQKHRRMLAINYASTGIQYASSGNPQEALLYFTEALNANPRESSAAAGVSFLLQDTIWPILAKKEQGFLQYGQPLPLSVYAYDSDSHTSLLLAKNFSFLVQNQNEELLFQSEEYGDFLGVHAGQWVFLCPDYSILFYNPIKDQCHKTEFPDTISDGAKRGYEFAQSSQAYALSKYDQNIYALTLNKPDAIALSEDRFLIAYGGIIYLHAPNEKNELGIIAQADLAKAFPDTAQRQLLSITNQIFISEDGRLAVIKCGTHAAVYDTENLTLRGSMENYRYQLNDIDVSIDGEYFAAAYGNLVKNDTFNPGGYFAIYTPNSECLFTLPVDIKKSFSGIAFNDLNPDQILVWGQDFAEVWDWKKGIRIAAPILSENIESAAFSDDGMILIDSGDDYVQYFKLSAPIHIPIDAENIPALQEPQIQNDSAQLPEGLCLSAPKAGKLILTDEASGQILSEAAIPPLADIIALSEDTTKAWIYDNYSPILGQVKINYKKRQLGEFREINTHGNIIQYIWFYGEWVVAETSEANLLIYDTYGSYKTEIQTQHSGYLDFLMISPNNNYLIAVCSTKKQQTGTLTDKIINIEIWDLNTNLLVKSFEYEDTNINKMDITPEGMLIWETTESSFSYQLEMPIPNKSALDYLQGIGCCYFDKNQQILYKEPMQGKSGWGKLTFPQ